MTRSKPSTCLEAGHLYQLEREIIARGWTPAFLHLGTTVLGFVTYGPDHTAVHTANDPYDALYGAYQKALERTHKPRFTELSP